MKYLKITTIIYDQSQINDWVKYRLDEETANELTSGGEITLQREKGTTTQYKLVEGEQMINKPLKEDWEERLENQFAEENDGWLDGTKEDFKSFIRDLLSQTKSQIVEQILGMECIKEEKEPTPSSISPEMLNRLFEETKNRVARNKLRLQIKEEIKKL